MVIANVVKASQAMALAPSPSNSSMDAFRTNSRLGTTSGRAANGESLLLYGESGTPAPYYVAALWAEHFDPFEHALVTWLMNPFLEIVYKPFRSFLLKLPMISKWFENKDPNVEIVSTGTIFAFAKAFMVVMAILFLTAAIFTLQVVKSPKVRIMTMGLFAQVFALPVQFLGSRSLPLYTLVTG
jgi:hypothetical protein